MKCVVLFVAVCAFAGAFGHPVSEQKSRASIADELRSVPNDVHEVSNEPQAALKQDRVSRRDAPSGPSEGEGPSRIDWLRERIAEIREAIAASTKELASIIWQQARAHGEALQEKLAAAKQQALKRLTELKSVVFSAH